MITRPRVQANLIAAAAIAVSCSCGLAFAEPAGPLGPAESLAQIQLDPELEIQLVACEPEVIDPVAIRFDEYGRLWVVEMRDYPNGPAEGVLPQSQIRLLADRDGDGRYETSQVFADELLFANGIQPWRGGLIVTLAGEVAYLKDTDGDGRADLHETWYRGFTQGNPQLRANHPRFGLDNRISIANGLMGGVVENLRDPGRPPVEISGRDFRFEPLAGDCEAISGNGQFGNTSDEFGRRFVCSNRQPLDHVVLENRYLKRNPLAGIPAVLQPVVAAGEQSHVYPLTKAWTTSNLHAGQFTAACGIEIDRGSALGIEYRGCSFTCEPTGSLVHRERISAHGASFKGEPATPGREFLASRDSWFRPVNLEWGPDGALYVVDMYRAVIEHPQYMPEELQQRPDQRLGDDRGRIYRVVPKGLSLQLPGALSTASTTELVERLKHEHAWQRETAARLLYERQDKSAVKPLADSLRGAYSPSCKVASLAALSGLKALTAEHLLTALGDAEARVREYAVLQSEDLLSANELLRHRIIELANDSDARLRFQITLSLGGESSDEYAPLAKISRRDAADSWVRSAVSLATPAAMEPIVRDILAPKNLPGVEADDPRILLVRQLSEVVGARRDPVDFEIRAKGIQPPETTTIASLAMLCGVADGCARRGQPFLEFVASLPDPKQVSDFINAAFGHAVRIACDSNRSESDRTLALELLAHATIPSATQACLAVLQSSDSQKLRSQAARSLAGHPQSDLADVLLATYPYQSPAVRTAILESLCMQSTSALALLEAVRAKMPLPTELGAGVIARLQQHRDEKVRSLAADVLKFEIPAERKAVLADYQRSLELKPDVPAGKSLFRQHCSTCHHIGDVGVDVAPDISDSRVKTAAQLLTDILNPNQAIDNNYVSYTVVMNDGNVHTGLIAAETASSVTLRQPENKTITVLRADIETLRSSGVSLMPEGFEKHLTHQQLADLIGFVKNWRYLETRIPGTVGAPNGE
jgi:putative membrane-bound dehydrogenase-like protein